MRIKDYLGRYERRLLALLWAVGLVSSLLALVMPQQLGRLTNLFSGEARVSWSQVGGSVAMLVGSQLAVAVLGFCQMRTQVTLQEDVNRNLSGALFRRILRFDAAFFREVELERVTARAVDDANRVATFWIATLAGIPSTVAGLVLFGAMMFATNAFLATLVVLLSVLSAYNLLLNRRLQDLNTRVSHTWDLVRVRANEMIRSADELRHNAAFAYGFGKISEAQYAYRNASVERGKLNALFSSARPLIASLQTGGLLLAGTALCVSGSGLQRLGGRLNWGDVIKFLFLAQAFRQPVQDVFAAVYQWRSMRVCLDRVHEYLTRPVVGDEAGGAMPAPVAATTVDFQAVAVDLPTGARLLDGVDAYVGSGEHVTITGPAGCGKTTAIRTIVRDVSLTRGCIQIGGVPLDGLTPGGIAERVGYLMQHPTIFNASLRSNLLIGLRRDGDSAVRDDEGPLSLELEPGEPAEQRLQRLDAQLVAAVRDVGLDRDIFLKGLENPAPTSWVRRSRLIERIGPLRGVIASRLAELPHNGYAPLSDDRSFPGSLRENLAWAAPADDRATGAIVDRLSGQPVFLSLLQLGAAQVGQQQAKRSPALSNADVSVRRLLDEVQKASDARCVPERYWNALLDAGLGMTADEAAAVATDVDWEATVLAGRLALWACDAVYREPWDALAGGRYVEGASVGENLLAGRLNGRVFQAVERGESLLRDVLEGEGLVDDILHMGLEQPAGDGGVYLSGGQRQKVALARVLVKAPQLLLLDEATASLDEVSQMVVVDLLRTRCADLTVLSVTHRLNVIRETDRVLVFDRGRIVQDGPYGELARSDGLLRSMIAVEHKLPSDKTTEPAPLAPDLQNLVRRLSLSPLFASLQSAEIGGIARVVRVVEVAPETILFRRGDPGTDMYFILDGKVEFLGDEDRAGERPGASVDQFGPGESFGELALFRGGGRLLTAITREACVLALLSRDDLERVLEQHPRIAWKLLEHTAEMVTYWASRK